MTGTGTRTPAPSRISRSQIMTLVVASFALFMAMLDNTVVNVALTTIQADLDIGISGLQWVVSGYTLAFASLMLSGGTVADLFGRKRTFQTGLALFTVASLGCALAPEAGWLIAARIAQGVGAALLQPASLAVLTAAFPGAAERARAIGIWAGVSGLALGMGPVVGGALVEHASWQSVFLVNVPIGILGMVVAHRHVTESHHRGGRGLDLRGQVLAVITLSSLTYALIEANDRGWTSTFSLSLFAIAVVTAGLFVREELRSASPMLDLRFFRNPAFAGANVVGFAVGLGMFAIFFFLSINLQQTYGYSAFEAGVRILPVTIAIILAAPLSGWLAASWGPKVPLVLGLGLAGTAQLLLLTLDADSAYHSYVWILPLSGLGVGLTMTPMTAAVMEAVPTERAGMASATTSTAREVGGNFGIAFIGALLVARFNDALTDRLTGIGMTPAAAEAVATSAGSGAGDHANTATAGEQALDFTRLVNESFVEGLHVGLIAAAGFLFAAMVIAWITIPSRRRGTRHDPARSEPARDHIPNSLATQTVDA